MLSPEEMRALIGLRDRALIAVMTYTFARVGAVVRMRVEDYYIKAARVGCNRTRKAVRCIMSSKAGLEQNKKRYFFRSAVSKSGGALADQDAHAMIRRRAAAAGIRTAKIGCHTLRAIGITAYMKNGGRLEVAQQIARHEFPRTTRLYDRSSAEISLDELRGLRFDG